MSDVSKWAKVATIHFERRSGERVKRVLDGARIPWVGITTAHIIFILVPPTACRKAQALLRRDAMLHPYWIRISDCHTNK